MPTVIESYLSSGVGTYVHVIDYDGIVIRVLDDDPDPSKHLQDD